MIYIYIYIIIYTWILLIVETSTLHTKAKIDQFCQIQEKKTTERLFPLQNVFLTLERFRTVLNVFLNVFLTLFERFFPLQNVRSVKNGKFTLVFFFHTNPQHRSFLGSELKKSVFGSSRYILYYIIYNYIMLRSCLRNWDHPYKDKNNGHGIRTDVETQPFVDHFIMDTMGFPHLCKRLSQGRMLW